MKFTRKTVSLTDPRVVAHLTAATTGAHPMKIILEKTVSARGKKILRAHRDRAGRFFVMIGFRGNSRWYLSNQCTIIEMGDDMSPIVTFMLDLGSDQRVAA